MKVEPAEGTKFLKTLNDNSTLTQELLDQILPSGPDKSISEAMRYAVLNGGKRLRSFLAIESAVIFNVNKSYALRAACAIECLHSYSLVHDDLPSMDNDDMRRGKLTVHKKWDEATAILVGDALQSKAFEILSQKETHPKANIRIDLIQSLAKAAGIKGMVGGQELDIKAEKACYTLNLNDIQKLQNLKTGALIIWSAQVGARLAQQDIKPLTDYASLVGLAFQIQDDILDETGEIEKTGKKTGKDANAGKATFVSVLGLEGAKEKSKDLVSLACKALEPYGKRSELLKEAAHFVIERNF